MEVLNTERLKLRPYTMEDINAIHAYGSDPEVVKYMTFGPNTYEESYNFLNTLVNEFYLANPLRNYNYAIEYNGEVVGSVSLALNEDLTEGEMGWVLIKKFHGLGIMTEAAKCLKEYGFKKLGLKRIYAICDTNNKASENVMKKIGLKFSDIEKNFEIEKKIGIYICDRYIYEEFNQ